MDPLIEAEARRIEAEQKAEQDELERVLAKPPDPAVLELIADEEARHLARQNADPETMLRELEVRAGMRDPDEVPSLWSASEIAAHARRTGWSARNRSDYLAAIKREKVAKRAGSYRGAA